MVEKRKISKEIFSWLLFDFANSSYAVIIIAFLFPVYFSSTIAKGNPFRDLYYSVSVSISMLFVAVLNPILGASSDFYSNKKKFLIFFTILCVVATSLLFFSKEGMIIYAMSIFVLANIGFNSSLVFYDSFLPKICEKENLHKISSYGYAFGYIGSLISVAITLFFIEVPENSFLATGIFFLFFSLPIFFILKEEKKEVVEKINVFQVGIQRILQTLKELKLHKKVALFLISYFFYIDVINTIIFFSGIFAKETLKFSMEYLAYFFIIVQFMAFVGAILFSKLATIFGEKKILLFNLFSWMILIAAIYFVENKNLFFVIGSFAGIFLGSTQSLSRSFYAKLLPQNKFGEFFGFYSMFEKTTSIIGPFVFGIVSSFTGNQKYAIVSLFPFLIFGIIILTQINVLKNEN